MLRFLFQLFILYIVAPIGHPLLPLPFFSPHYYEALHYSYCNPNPIGDKDSWSEKTSKMVKFELDPVICLSFYSPAIMLKVRTKMATN